MSNDRDFSEEYIKLVIGDLYLDPQAVRNLVEAETYTDEDVEQIKSKKALENSDEV